MKAPPPFRLVVLMGLLLSACGTPSDPTPPVPTPVRTSSPLPSTSSPPPATATPLESPEPSAGETPEPIAADPPPLALQAVAAGFDAPIGIAPLPDGRLLVNERAGRVVVLDPENGRTSVALDIRDRVLGGGEQGLLGLALHPDWPDDPRAFVHYSDRNGDTVLSEIRAADVAGAILDPASERVLLQVDQPYSNHNGGQVAFGPDGYLYLGLGDGGAGSDPHDNGQNPRTLLGTVMRIDPDAPDDAAGSMPYGIPPDNPYAAGADGAPEVFLIGLRNPWRFSFDGVTDALWIADVGQNAFEEVDRIDPATGAGANLGWNRMEASHCFTDPSCSSEGLVMPVAEYGRDQGCSVTGGYVYRGEAIRALRGWYLFSDYCSGLLFAIRSDAEGVNAPRVLLQTGASVSSFGQDAEGELYLADLGSGDVYRVVAGG